MLPQSTCFRLRGAVPEILRVAFRQHRFNRLLLCLQADMLLIKGVVVLNACLKTLLQAAEFVFAF